MSSHQQSSQSSVHPMQQQPRNTMTPSLTGRFSPKIRVPHHYPSSSNNPNHGVIGIFKDFREFRVASIQQWMNSWLKLGPIVVQKLSRRVFVFQCILQDDKRSLLHHTSAYFHASLVIFKDWREDLALQEYRFAESALWVRVEGIPANVNQTNISLNILGRIWHHRYSLRSYNDLNVDKPKETTNPWVIRSFLERAKKRIWEPSQANFCNQGEDQLVSSPTDTPLYTNKVRYLKGIPQNKTTTLDLRLSVQNIKLDKYLGHSDSSSSKKDDDEEDEQQEDGG
ncbi:Ribosomal protein S12 mitochondrial [Bienertia sinuspersici]